MTSPRLKRKLVASVFVPTAIGLLAGGSVLAAGTDKPAASQHQEARAQDKTAKMSAAKDIRASTLLGMEVVNAQGENLGEIHDLVVDVNNERVHYAVLAFGGIAGLAEKLFAYPVKTFSQRTEDDKLVLNVDQERLERAPGFATNNWPDWNRDEYRGDVDRYFGPTVTLKHMPNQELMRASELLGRDVDDTAGRDAGEIEDLVVNLGNGKVHYAVLDPDLEMEPDDILVPISLSAFKIRAQGAENFVLNMPRDRINTDLGFRENDWPDFNDPGYERDMDRRLRGAS